MLGRSGREPLSLHEFDRRKYESRPRNLCDEHGIAAFRLAVEVSASFASSVEARAEAVARQSPGVPVAVIRNLLTAHEPACRCAQYLKILDKGAG